MTWNPVFGDPDAPKTEVVVYSNNQPNAVDYSQLIVSAYIAGAITDMSRQSAYQFSVEQRQRYEDILMEDLKWNNPDVAPGILRQYAREYMAEQDRQRFLAQQAAYRRNWVARALFWVPVKAVAGFLGGLIFLTIIAFPLILIFSLDVQVWHIVVGAILLGIWMGHSEYMIIRQRAGLA